MTTKLGPWPLGIDNITQDAALSPGALRDALNVTIDDDGTIDSAAALELVLPASGLHSLWSAGDGSAYCIGGGTLYECAAGELVAIGSLPSDGPAAYERLNEQVLIATRQGLFRVKPGGVEPMALAVQQFAARAVESGGLRAGRYGVAVSLRRSDEESGLSAMRLLEVAEGGGIELDLPGGDGVTAVSIYRTDANGAELYRALDAPADFPGYRLGAGKLGAMPGTRFMEPLPGGHIVRAWMGRLLVANGRTLAYSAPLRYGLHNPAEDFIHLASRIRMVLPVNDGVFIADTQRCYFLAGTDPEQWVLQALDAAPPPEGASAVIDGSLLADEMNVPSVPVAAWLSEKGFVLGLPGGQLAMPQEKRLRLPMPGRGWLVANGHRLYAGS